MTTIKNVIHFVTSGTAKFMFNVGKELFFVPAVMILKCLTNRCQCYKILGTVTLRQNWLVFFKGFVQN